MGCSDSKAAPVDEPTDAPTLAEAVGNVADAAANSVSQAASSAAKTASKAADDASKAVDKAAAAADEAMKPGKPHTFDSLEKEIREVIKSEEKLDKLWNRLDFNGNGKVSLAELTLFVKRDYPILDNSRALMRAYKQTTQKDGDGDAYIERHEFIALLRNLFYYNRAWDLFEGIDKDADRRVDVNEFKAGVASLNEDIEDPEAEFKKIDTNNGGVILFDEFCEWLANRRCPLE